MTVTQALIVAILQFFLVAPVLSAPMGPPELPQAQVGDVILLPLRCTLCSAISTETGSEYSHSGVLIRSPEGQWAVAQALGKVNMVPVRDFLAHVAPGKRPGIFRHKDLAHSQRRGMRLWAEFQNRFNGLPFDHLFLWDNQDAEGHELFYCSEFVAKFLNRVLPRPIRPLPMNFSQNPAFWERYFSNFGGTVPQDLLGLSPADIEHSEDFSPVVGP